MIEEVFRIPELIRQKRKEEVLEIIKKNNLSIIDVLSILAGQRTAEITKQLCGYCEHGVKKSREAVFCSIWQERRGKAKIACRYFKRGD